MIIINKCAVTLGNNRVFLNVRQKKELKTVKIEHIVKFSLIFVFEFGKVYLKGETTYMLKCLP